MNKYIVGFIFIFILMLPILHPFLAINNPVDSKVMVIEGWIPAESINYVVRICMQNNYEKILITNSQFITSSKTAAMSCKEMLEANGINGSQIFIIPLTRFSNSRTFSYAKSTVAWIMENEPRVRSFNVLTYGTHARKSYILYKKAATDHIQVGIISVPPISYTPRFWFLSLKGTSYVVKNLVGFLYAKVL